MGNLLRQGKRAEDAARAYSDALRFYRELLERMTGFSEHHLDLAGALNNLALVHFEIPGRRDEARKLHGEARQVLTALAQAYPRRAEYAFRLGQTCSQASRLEQAPGRWEQAAALLADAVRHQRDALRLDPVNTEYGENLRESFLTLASVQVRLGRHADAARTADQMARQFPNDWKEHCRSLVVLGYCIPLAERDAALTVEQRAARVDDYHRQARSSITELLAEAETNLDAQLEVAWLLVSSPVSRLRDPERALDLARRGAKAAPTESARASFLNTLGVAHYRLGQWEQARETLNEAAALRAGGNFNDWVFLAMSCWQLQKKETARLYLAQAENALRRKGQLTRDERRFLEEAITLIRKGTGTPP
jgi:tetratricopeptide (TPR) repeat protein